MIHLVDLSLYTRGCWMTSHQFTYFELFAGPSWSGFLLLDPFDFQRKELNQRDESISIVKPQLPTLEQFQQLHRQSCKEVATSKVNWKCCISFPNVLYYCWHPIFWVRYMKTLFLMLWDYRPSMGGSSLGLFHHSASFPSENYIRYLVYPLCLRCVLWIEMNNLV